MGIPLFEEANATKFLDCYNDLCKEYLVLEENKLVKLLQYYSRNIGNAIKSLKAQEDKDYLALWKTILKEYKDYNSYQQTYSLQFLEKYKSIIYTKKDNILQYYHHFNMIAKVLIQQNVLSIYTTRVWFLHRLLSSTTAKVIRKHDIDTKDFSTINYCIIHVYIEKLIVLEKTIQRMQIEKVPNANQKVELEELVG